ncbi:unnamed protein product [Leptosia nina]|uniref:Uncharacterized protein n=1 Tax=Leptosia nina TaxID=320188 RepID=A0AAV1K5M5_9NEOP
MPKYYRFRATPPDRKPKRKEREREIAVRNVEHENDINGLDLTLLCSPSPSWYLRRIAWRETVPVVGFQRQLSRGLQTLAIYNNRPVFVFIQFDPKI